MRSALLCIPFLLAAGFTPTSPPACGDAALAAAPDTWDAANAVTGDLTLDGNEDVAFWKTEAGAVMLYIAACDGDRPVETWRYRIPLAEDCPPEGVVVEMATLLLDAELVDRVCAAGESDECQHMLRENERRQALTDAGGRELRIGGPASTGARLRWSVDQNGFMRFGG